MKLNGEQEKAANHRQGAACVIAGPGSGKTRTMIERTRMLLEEGIKPKELLLITFTVKAAKEMRSRLSEYYPVDDMYIMTFHAFCLRVLNKFSPKRFGVMDEDEAGLFFWRIAKEMGKDGSCYKNVVQLKESGISVDDFKEQTMSEINMKDIWRKYEEAKREELLFDYQDLQINFIKAAKKSDGIKMFLSEFKYVCIDEFQDTSSVQMNITRILCEACNGNIFCVGDPKQSIYKFRGAVVENILDFSEHFPGSIKYELSSNYRSGKDIVKHANLLIYNNKEGKECISKPFREFDGNVSSFDFSKTFEEEQFVKEMVMAAVTRKETCAILCRTRALAEKYEAILRISKSGIKKVNLKKTKVVARAYEELDDITFSGILKLAMNASTFTNFKNNNPNPLQAVKNNDMKGVSSKTKDLVKESFTKIVNLRKEPMWDVLTLLAKEDVDNSDRILDAAKEVWYEGVMMDEWINLIEEYISDTDENKLVHIMTIHKSKGLEFDNVFLPNFVNGYMPMGSDHDEERRLAFVAYTRAIKSLILTYSFQDSTGRGMSVYPSRFIREAKID